MTIQSDNNTKSKKIIVFLVILLLLSLFGLLGRYFYLNNFQKNNKVTVPDNVIGEITNKVEDESNISTGDDDQNLSNTGNNGNNNSSTNDKSTNSSNELSNDKSKDEIDRDNNNSSDNTSSDDNKNEIEAPEISLDEKEPSDNERFDVSNMLPGDSVTKYFCVKISHDFDVKVYFESTVIEETKNLGDVLNIKVTDVTKGADNGKIVAQGSFNEINKKSYPVKLYENRDGHTVKYYKIDVSLDTSVGNPYQAAKLSANFKWYVTDDEVKALSKEKPVIPGITNPDNKDKNETTKTGDIFDKSLWIIFIGSALMIVLLTFKNRKRKEDE